MWWSSRLLLLICAVGLAACGFRPLYEGGKGSQISRQLASVWILPIADRTGQQLRNDLLDRINPFGRPRDPLYALNVKILETKQELAVQKTELATRANLHITAEFTLRAKSGAGKTLFTGKSRITVSYNILAADFATLMAERGARRRAVRVIGADITDRLAAYFRLSGDPG